jgi:hypothetical protein
LAAADLITRGAKAFLTDEGFGYDLVVDVGSQLLKLQVKARSSMKATKSGSHHYKFMLLKSKNGHTGSSPYGSEIHGFALVMLDRRTVAYLPRRETPQWTIYLSDKSEIRSAFPVRNRIFWQDLDWDNFVKAVENR